MNWLLHRLQRLLGALSGQRSGSRSAPLHSASVPSDNRLSQQNGESVDSEFSLSSERFSPVQSTAPLRQNSSSALKDTVDPVADEPDTHRRLDAASAALPEAASVAPSFPTDISDLIPAGLLTVGPIVETPDDSQLPKIHDLLPAVEPEAVELEDVERPEDSEESLPASPNLLNIDLSESSLSGGETKKADVSVSQLPESAEPSLQIEVMPSTVLPADLSEPLKTSEPVKTSEQAVLFSFDITESESTFEGSVPFPQNGEAQNREAQDEEASASQTADMVLEVLPNAKQISVEDDQQALEIFSAEDPALENSIAIDRPLEAAVNRELGDHELDDYEANNHEASNQTTKDGFEPSSEFASADKELSPVSPAEKSSEPSAVTGINDFPYPWSLTTPSVPSEPMVELPKIDRQLANEATDELPNELPNEDETNSSTPRGVQLAASPSAGDPSAKRGVVKLLFTLKKGNFHGYIAPDDGTKDILFHQKYINADIFDGLERGAKVAVWVTYIEGKAYATRIDLL